MLPATEEGFRKLWQKSQDDRLGSFRDHWCTNLRNFEKSTSKKIDCSSKNTKKIVKHWSRGQGIDFWMVMKIVSRSQGIDFYHANHFSNLLRIWWEIFCKNRFLKKIFLKVLINHIFARNCSTILSLQKTFPSNLILSKFEKWFA